MCKLYVRSDNTSSILFDEYAGDGSRCSFLSSFLLLVSGKLAPRRVRKIALNRDGQGGMLNLG